MHDYKVGDEVVIASVDELHHGWPEGLSTKGIFKITKHHQDKDVVALNVPNDHWTYWWVNVRDITYRDGFLAERNEAYKRRITSEYEELAKLSQAS